MTSRILNTLAVALAAALLSASAHAAIITWSGAGDGTTWNDGANWTGGLFPGVTDEALFDGTVVPSVVTNVSGNVLALTVNSQTNPDLNITFELQGNTNLTSSAGMSLFLGAGDAVVFDNAGSVTRVLEVRGNLDSGGGGSSLTFLPGVTLRTAVNPLTLFVRSQATLDIQGMLEVTSATELNINNSSGVAVADFNDVQLLAELSHEDAGGTPVVNVNGNITYLLDGAGWIDSSVVNTFILNLNGSIINFNSHDNIAFDFDQTQVFVAGVVTMTGAAGVPTWASTPRFDFLTVSAGALLSILDGLPSAPALFVNQDLVINGAMDIHGNDMVLYGTNWTVGAAGMFNQSGGSPATSTCRAVSLSAATSRSPATCTSGRAPW